MKKPKDAQEYDGYSLPERKEYSAEELKKMKEESQKRMEKLLEANGIEANLDDWDW